MTDRDAEFVTGLSRADTAQEPVRVEDWTNEKVAEACWRAAECIEGMGVAEDIAEGLREADRRLRARQRRGEREPDYVVDPETMGSPSPRVWVPGQVMYQKWLHDVGDTRENMVALYTEPPAMREPDLDELTPKCPACGETIHDCECNPYMDTEERDG